jgi:hypothetical protein
MFPQDLIQGRRPQQRLQEVTFSETAIWRLERMTPLWSEHVYIDFTIYRGGAASDVLGKSQDTVFLTSYLKQYS